MWPFGGRGVDEETRARLDRKCGLALAALRNCRAANGAAAASACSQLEESVVFCHAEVAAPDAAAAYQHCFMKAANAGAGAAVPARCAKEAAAMRKSLRRLRLYPFK
jgi:hypothetical protein